MKNIYRNHFHIDLEPPSILDLEMEAIRLKTFETISAQPCYQPLTVEKVVFMTLLCSLVELDYVKKKVCLFFCKRGKPHKMSCMRVLKRIVFAFDEEFQNVKITMRLLFTLSQRLFRHCALLEQ